MTCHGILRTGAEQGTGIFSYHWMVIAGNFYDNGSVIHLETMIDACPVTWIGVDHGTGTGVCHGTGNHASCCHVTGTGTSAGTLIAPALLPSRLGCPRASVGVEGLAFLVA